MEQTTSPYVASSAGAEESLLGINWDSIARLGEPEDGSDEPTLVIDGEELAWRDEVLANAVSWSRMAVVFSKAPTREAQIDLVSMGFRRVVGFGDLAWTKEGSAPDEVSPSREIAVFGPLAWRVLAEVPGVFEGGLRDTGGDVVVVADGTPWSGWVRRLEGPPDGGAGRLTDLNLKLDRWTVQAPRVAIDVQGRLPWVIDRVDPHPVVLLHDSAVPGELIARATEELSLPKDLQQRPLRRVAALDGNGKARQTDRLTRKALEGVGVVVLPHVAFRSDLDRAIAALTTGSLGVPVYADRVSTMARYLGPRFSELLSRMDLSNMDDSFVRDRVGVDLHREVVREHSADHIRARMLDRPPHLADLSVLVDVGDGKGADRVLRDLSKQSIPDAEVVLVVSGDAPTGRALASWRRECRFEVTVGTFGGPSGIGERYTRATLAASGDRVTIWRVNDHYGVDHLWDLSALSATFRVDMLGKAEEFIHYRDIDTTLQMDPTDRWRETNRLALGAFAADRATLLELGGFPRSVGRIMDPVIDRMRHAGGRVLRVHGYGHLLSAPAFGAAPDPDVRERDVRQWPGLALVESGVGAGVPRRTRRYA